MSKPDSLGLGTAFVMSQYITEEDIQMELEKLMEKCGRDADGDS